MATTPVDTRPRRLPVLGAVAVAVTLAFTGCGDDDDEAAETTDTTTTPATAPGASTPNGPGRTVPAPAVELEAQLTGAAEKPGPGDTDGSGSATVVLSPTNGQVCYQITVEGIEAPTKAHIHEGVADTPGPVFISFFEAEGGALQACIQAEPTKVAEVVRNPASYYVNVHTASFPAGAVRGQLAQ